LKVLKPLLLKQKSELDLNKEVHVENEAHRTRDVSKWKKIRDREQVSERVFLIKIL
jgi:hypothetical protein